MIAELHIFGDCSSPEPTKKYTLYRLTPYLKGQLQDFILKKFNAEETKELMASPDVQGAVKKKYEKVSDEEMKQDLIRLVRLFFPEITEEEILMCDFGDDTGTNGQFYEFLHAISGFATSTEQRAIKN